MAYITKLTSVEEQERPEVDRNVRSRIPFPEINVPHTKTGVFCQATFPVGATASRHTHSESAEWYLIQSGRAKITIDDETHDIEAGDVIYTPWGSTHNIHDVEEELVFIAAEIPRVE